MTTKSAQIIFASNKELNDAVQRLADAAGSTVRDVLPAQMRLFAADLAFNTRPIGKGTGDNKQNQTKIEIRIGTIYPPIGWAVNLLKASSEQACAAFLRNLEAKNYSVAAGILNRFLKGRTRYAIGPFDNGSLHKKQQFSRKITHGLIVTDSYGKVKAYIAKKKKLVGYAKGGFATAARQLGGVRGIPGFATRQKAPGKGYVRGGGSKLEVHLQNDVDYIEKALDAHGEARAIHHRRRSIDLVLKRMADRKFKSASRSLK